MQTADRHKARRRPVQSSVGPSTSSSLFGTRTNDGILSLNGRDFVLDVENRRMLVLLTAEIERLGGRIVPEINEENKPFCIVSDSPHMEKIERLKPELIVAPMMKALPRLVRDAIRLGIRFRSCKTFVTNLDRLKLKIKNQKKVMATPTKKPVNVVSQSQTKGPITLQPPYLKMEDNRGAFSPLYKQFTQQSNCQKVYLGKHMGKSLFHRNHHPDAPNKTEKSPCEKQKLALLPKGGYCEVCCKNFDNSKEHFASREHIMSVSQPGLWSSVDKLCGSWLDYVSSSKPPRTRRHRHSPPSPSDHRHSH